MTRTATAERQAPTAVDSGDLLGVIESTLMLFKLFEKLFNVNECLDNRSRREGYQDGDNDYDTQKLDHTHAGLS